MTLYLAAPQTEAQSTRAIAALLRTRGYVIASTWHDTIKPGWRDTQLSDDDRRDIRTKNYEDLDLARTIVVLAHAGAPAETFCEAGAALDRGYRAIWIHGPTGEGRALSDSHPRVTRIRWPGGSNEVLAEMIHEALCASCR